MSRKQLDRTGGDLTGLGDDDTGCTILHLDMDAFFVSVERLLDPSLIDRPVIVGGRSGRGVVASASYEARAYGVHSAMPIGRALTLCPNAVVVPPTKGVYSEYSDRVFAVVSDVTPDFSRVSVDEGYIDVSGAVRRLGSPARIALHLRQTIAERMGLPSSIGLSKAMVVAKIASARAKPNGQLVVPVGKEAQFMESMPVTALPGVGRATHETLSRYGIRTIGDLARQTPAWAAKTLGSAGPALVGYAQGRDHRTVHDRAKDHSISAESTFDDDIYQLERLRTELLRLADKVTARVRAEGLAAGTVTLKFRSPDFTTITRSVTLPAPTDVTGEVYEALLGPLETAAAKRTGARLLGVAASNLQPVGVVGRQETLESSGRSTRESDIAVDEIRKKFGKGAISPASLLRPE